MKQVKQQFHNVFTYASGMGMWVERNLGFHLEYTFVCDFAIADWTGKKAVNETYQRVKKEWLGNYKAFTEVVIALNMLSWGHHQLAQQGYEGREVFVKLYSDLYYKAKNAFYKKYEKDSEACDYFYRMTD